MDPRGEEKVDEAVCLLMQSPEVSRKISTAIGRPQAAAITSVKRGVVHGTGDSQGETDIFVEYSDGGVVLCESKFTAGFQPRQGARYAERLEELVRSGVPFATSVLIGPAGYLRTKQSTPEGRAFVHRLSLEQLLDWVDEIEAGTVGERTARRFLAELVTDWNAKAFQGQKGKWPANYNTLRVHFESAGTGWYVMGNPGDWVHIWHEATREVKFHFRNKKNSVSLEFQGRLKGLGAAEKTEVERRGWKVNGSRDNVIEMPLLLSKDVREDQLSASDTERVSAGLESLLKWWRSSLY